MQKNRSSSGVRTLVTRDLLVLLSYLQHQFPHRRAFGATKNRVAYFNVRTQFLTENFTIPFFSLCLTYRS